MDKLLVLYFILLKQKSYGQLHDAVLYLFFDCCLTDTEVMGAYLHRCISCQIFRGPMIKLLYVEVISMT